MKLTQTNKGIYENTDLRVEICKDSALCLDFNTKGWVLFIGGEWIDESTTKKSLIELAEKMT